MLGKHVAMTESPADHNLAATFSELAVDAIDALPIDDDKKVKAFDIVLDEGKAEKKFCE